MFSSLPNLTFTILFGMYTVYMFWFSFSLEHPAKKKQTHLRVASSPKLDAASPQPWPACDSVIDETDDGKVSVVVCQLLLKYIHHTRAQN
jgi:hypothetical protein